MKKFYRDNFIDPSTRGEWFAVICCIAMIAGLFFSRAVLSGSMILLLVNALFSKSRLENIRAWGHDPFSWFCLSFFFVYLLSGIWSDNKEFWWAGVVNKLPFVILPFSMCSVPFLKIKYQRVIIGALLLMQSGIIANSIFQLIIHKEFYLQGYHVSQPLPTTKYGDHIRFSLSLVLSVLMCFYLLFDQAERPLKRIWKVLLGICVLIFVLYIHVLAAKTGLVCLYLMGTLYAFIRLLRYNKIMALILPVLIVILPVFSYYVIPTFRTKVDYVVYEINKTVSEQKYDYTLSDAGRMITYDIGLRSIARHPLMGVGAGDLMDEMRKGYRKYYPEVSAEQQYGPINQFLYTALCVGIPLSLSLLGMTCFAFAGRGRLKGYLVLTALLMFVSIMVESMLELQFGVFTYLFFILFWKYVLKDNTGKTSGIHIS